MLLDDQFHARLSSDPMLTALVGDRLYPEHPVRNVTPLPFVTYTRTFTETSFSLEGSGKLVRAEYDVDITAATAESRAEVADAVRTRLDNFGGGNILWCRYASESQGADPELYLSTQTFTVHGSLDAVVYATTGLPRLEVRPDGLYFGGEQLGEGDKHYTHTQSTPSTTWTVTHNLGKYPTVNILDSAGTEVLANVTHVNLNTLTVTLSQAVAGKCVCN